MTRQLVRGLGLVMTVALLLSVSVTAALASATAFEDRIVNTATVTGDVAKVLVAQVRTNSPKAAQYVGTMTYELRQTVTTTTTWQRYHYVPGQDEWRAQGSTWDTTATTTTVLGTVIYKVNPGGEHLMEE